MALDRKYFKIPLLLCGAIVLVGVVMNYTSEVSGGVLQAKGGSSRDVIMSGNTAIAVGILMAAFILIAGGFFSKRKK